MPHIVDILIEERAERLMRHPMAWRAVKFLIYPILGYRRTVELVNFVEHMGGLEVFHKVSDLLHMDVECAGLDHLPSRGLAFVMPNHPAGIADGIAVFDAFKTIRQDISFFANRDAIRACAGLTEMIVPVEWVDDRRDHATRKEMVRNMLQAIRAERLIVIFPAGRLARPSLRGLIEREWQPTALNLALRYACPVLPLHISGRNSWLYYLFYFLHTELRDMALFRELLNKQGQKYRLVLAKPFIATGDAEQLSTALRRFVAEEMPLGAREFRPAAPGGANPGC